MNGRVGPVGDMELQNLSSHQMPAVDSDEYHPYADVEEGSGNGRINKQFRNLPSRSGHRSMHNTASGPRRRANSSRRVSMRPSDIEVVNVEEDDEDEVEHGSAKALPQPMSAKRQFRKSLKSRKAKRISRWKSFKLRVAMYFHLTRSSISEQMRDIELWKGHLKEVEGRFGNGVLSFFNFLKWLLFLNMVIFILEFGLVSLPTVILNESNSTTNPNTNSTCTIANTAVTETSLAEDVVGFFTGTGWINVTFMFYAGYPANELPSDEDPEYDLPLAYLLVGGSYFLCSLILMVRNLARSFKENYIESGGTTYSFSNKVFASWDYCICDENTAKVKCQNIVQDIKADLAEEERLTKVQNRTTGQKCRLYTLRFLITFIVMILLGGAIYAIIKAVEISTDPDAGQNLQDALGNFGRTLLSFAPSLTITALNIMLPVIFNILSDFEDWSPRFEVSLNLWRTVLLKLASVAVLMITLYTNVEDRCKEFPETCCQQNWENQIASQMYMLVWIDFFVQLFVLIVVSTIWKLLFKKTTFFKRIGMPEFNIPKEVLQLVYGECLIWIGTFFSPLMPAMGVVKLFIQFYLQKYSIMYNNKPSDKIYQGTRSNYLFTVLLLVTFLMCLVAVGWGITSVRPSCQGPFSNLNCNETMRIFDVLSEEISTWPDWLQEIIGYASTSAFIFPVLTIFCLLLYYFHSMTKSHLHVIEMLKDQLVLEGRDKRFLMEKLVHNTKKPDAGNNDYDSESDDTQETTLQPNYNKGGVGF